MYFKNWVKFKGNNSTFFIFASLLNKNPLHSLKKELTALGTFFLYYKTPV